MKCVTHSIHYFLFSPSRCAAAESAATLLQSLSTPGSTLERFEVTKKMLFASLYYLYFSLPNLYIQFYFFFVQLFYFRSLLTLLPVPLSVRLVNCVGESFLPSITQVNLDCRLTFIARSTTKSDEEGTK